MAYTTISKSSLHFNTKLYTGNGSTNAITGVGFQPDLTWLKNRLNSNDHQLYDAVRGATKYLRSESTDGEGTAATGLTAFNTDGFTLGSAGTTNNNSASMCSWNWKGGTTSGITTNGSTVVTPSSYSFNTTNGFGIYKYTGNGNTTTKVAHGLGKVPTMILIKKTSASGDNWMVYTQAVGNDTALQLDNNGASSGGSDRFYDTTPDTVNFTLGNHTSVNANGATYVAYVFCDVVGFSKQGMYTGNGNATNPPFVYTGFKPHYVLTKPNAAADSWQITDMARDDVIGGGNGTGARLRADLANSEDTNTTWAAVHKYSNGFSPQGTDGITNMDGRTYIYMAFGQSLVGSNNVPCTAR